MPSSPASNLDGFWISGRPEPPQSQLPAWQIQFISPNYFRSMGIPVIRGRTFTNHDGPETEKVVIISQSVAQAFFPDQDPLGKQLYDFHDRVGLKRNFYTVVGVVGAVQYDNPESQPTPYQCYYPYAQNTEPDRINFATLVLHTENNPSLLIEPLRKVVADLDPNLTVSEHRTIGRGGGQIVCHPAVSVDGSQRVFRSSLCCWPRLVCTGCFPIRLARRNARSGSGLLSAPNPRPFYS